MSSDQYQEFYNIVSTQHLHETMTGPYFTYADRADADSFVSFCFISIDSGIRDIERYLS